MSDPPLVKIERLRGPIERDRLGAREIERVARNASCLRLLALTLVGLKPITALKKILNEQGNEQQSTFALELGNRFERDLFDEGAVRLFELYRETERLSALECKIINVPDHYPSSTDPALAERARAARLNFTKSLLRRKLDGDLQAPNIIIKPRLKVVIHGLEHTIEPDALIASDTDRIYRPIEIKSYEDREGKTSQSDIQSACRQAAVGVIALRQTIGFLGRQYSDCIVGAKGDLILRKPGTTFPSLREMTLEREVNSIQQIIVEAGQRLRELEMFLPAGATISDPVILNSIPNHYIPDCREHCALAKLCKVQAIAAGDPVLLGKHMPEELAAAGSIGRGLELLHGYGVPPRTPEEAALQRRLQETLRYLGGAPDYGT